MFELQCNEACKTNGEMEVPLEATTEATQDNQDNVPQVGKRSYHLCIVCTFLSDSCVVGEKFIRKKFQSIARIFRSDVMRSQKF